MKEIKYGQYAKYEEGLKQIEKISNEWLDKNGQTFSYEIPLNDELKFLKDESVNPIRKQLRFTHSYNKDKNEWEHVSMQVMHTPKSLTDDLVTCVNPHNENFTISIISALSITNQVGCTCLNAYLALGERYVKAYKDCIGGMVNVILEELKISSTILVGQINKFNRELSLFLTLKSRKLIV